MFIKATHNREEYYINTATCICIGKMNDKYFVRYSNGEVYTVSDKLEKEKVKRLIDDRGRRNTANKVRSLPFFEEYINNNNYTYPELAKLTDYTEAGIEQFANGRSGSRKLVNKLEKVLKLDKELFSQIIE